MRISPWAPGTGRPRAPAGGPCRERDTVTAALGPEPRRGRWRVVSTGSTTRSLDGLTHPAWGIWSGRITLNGRMEMRPVTFEPPVRDHARETHPADAYHSAWALLEEREPRR